MRTLRNYITTFYKGLFGAPDENYFSLVETITHDIPHISAEENTILTADFTEKEVYEAVMQMKKNKAPGQDGFPIEFYQPFWELIKSDIMKLFMKFQQGELPLFHLNYGNIVWLPKKRKCHSDSTIPSYLFAECELQIFYQSWD